MKLTIRPNRRAGIAPAGIYFEAEATGFDVPNPYADLRYVWSFDDPGSYGRLAGSDMPWPNDRNIAYGPHCSHVFSASGRYRVRCEALSREMALAGTPPVIAEIEVVISDANQVFPATSTICIAPDGNFEGAPEGALKVADFNAAVGAGRRRENVRFLFRRGRRHDATSGGKSWAKPNTYRAMQAGAFGPGDDPIITSADFALRARKTDGEIAIWGLRFEGGYDSADPYSVDALAGSGITLRFSKFHTVWNCHIEGFNNNISGAPGLTDAVFGNLYVTSWHNYGFFANVGISHVGFCGCAILQKPGTVVGKGKHEKQPPFHADHGPWRCSSNIGPVSFNLFDVRSLNSWMGDIQPCIRLGGRGEHDAPLAARNSFDRIRAENGSCIGSGTYGGFTAYPKRAVYDKIYQVRAHDAGDGTVMSMGCGGMTVRNVITVIANQPALAGRLSRFVRRTDADRADPSNADQPVRIFNCTFVDLRDAQNNSAKRPGFVVADTESFAAPPVPIPFRFENNLVYIPNRPDGDRSAEPLDLGVLWKVTYDGRRFGENPFDALYAISEDTAARYAPLPGSPAYEGANDDLVAVDDFFGHLRGPSPSRGAIEPE